MSNLQSNEASMLAVNFLEPTHVKNTSFYDDMICAWLSSSYSGGHVIIASG